jgi:hypothetical protein
MCELNVGWSILFVASLMLLGFVLERINGKSGLMDEFLTPIPLGLVGVLELLLLAERSLA